MRTCSGLTVALKSDPLQTGTVMKRDGKQIRVDFGTHKLTLDYQEIVPVENSKPTRTRHEARKVPGSGSGSTAGGSHPRMYYDSRAAQEAADAALARRLAMLPPDEDLSPTILQEEADAALARRLAVAPTSCSSSVGSAMTDGGEAMYQPEWGEPAVRTDIRFGYICTAM